MRVQRLLHNVPLRKDPADNHGDGACAATIRHQYACGTEPDNKQVYNRAALMATEGSKEDGRSVLIKNLRFETSPMKVRRIFEEFGAVRDVYLPLDYYTKRPRGFGFVEFMDSRDALAAVRALNKTIVEGNEVIVVTAQDRRKSPETMRAMSHTTRRYRDGDDPSSRRRYHDDGSPSRGRRRRGTRDASSSHHRRDYSSDDPRYQDTERHRYDHHHPHDGHRGDDDDNGRSWGRRHRRESSRSRSPPAPLGGFRHDGAAYHHAHHRRPRSYRSPSMDVSRRHRSRTNDAYHLPHSHEDDDRRPSSCARHRSILPEDAAAAAQDPFRHGDNSDGSLMRRSQSASGRPNEGSLTHHDVVDPQPPPSHETELFHSSDAYD